jgi:hypothetical protein
VTHLNETAFLTYSELLDNTLHSNIAKKEGFGFTSKSKNGVSYWYLQHVIGDSRKQYYLGKESDDLIETMERQKKKWQSSRPQLKELEKLVSMAVAGGCLPISHKAYKVLSAVEQAGLFKAGGVLAGSYAFQAYGNMLGVSWLSKTSMTQDIDLAGSDECMIAIPGGIPPIGQTILNTDDAMLEIGMLNHKHSSTSYHIRGKDFRVDLITSLPPIGKETEAPVYIPAIKSYAKPLRFLDYILEDTQKAVLLHKDGVLVNVPSPARFAIHKLVVSQRRPVFDHLKSKKDIAQASQVIKVLLDIRPGDVWLAMDKAKAYPSKKFWSSMIVGIDKLDQAIKKPLLDYSKELSPKSSLHDDPTMGQ